MSRVKADIQEAEGLSHASSRSEGSLKSDSSWREKKRTYRRLMLRADKLFGEERLGEAETTFYEALNVVSGLVTQAPQDRWLLRDVARLHYGLAQLKRQQGFYDEALQAIRSCHGVIERLAGLDPAHVGRQNNLTISHAAIRDTLFEKGDVRLAIAAGRLAVICAENVADQFPDHADLRHEVIRQRLALAQIIDELNGGNDNKLNCLELACAAVKELPLPYTVTEEAWPDVRRAHLDLANGLQLARRYDETLDVLDEYRGYAMLRLVSGASDISLNNAVALADYLKGLVFVMKRAPSDAVNSFSRGLSLYEALPAAVFLTDDVQQQRAKLLAEAMKASEHSTDPALREHIERLALRRFQSLLSEPFVGAQRMLEIMARAHELSRMLIIKNCPHLALICLQFAGGILAERAEHEDDHVFVQRWAGFLKLEEGRALGAMYRAPEAQEALRSSLELNGQLWASNPSDVRAQCDVAYAEWQLAPLTPSGKRDHLRRSRAILRLLDRCGRLPDYAKPWLDEIERDLKAA